MKKKILSLITALSMVVAMGAMTKVEVKAAESVNISVTADKTEVNMNDEVNFTVSLNNIPATGAVAVGFDIDLPEGMELKSGEASSELSNTLKPVMASFNVNNGRFGMFGGANPSYTGNAVLCTFTCKVTVNNADLSVGIKNNSNLEVVAAGGKGTYTVNTTGCNIKVLCTHAWDAGKVTKEATCTEKGEKTYTCGNCSETKTEDIAATGHAWDAGKVTKEATCTEKGVKTYTCGNCSGTKTEDIAATGHAWDEGKVTKEATCTEKGERTYTCGNCSETKTEEIKAAGHTWDEGKVTKEATEKEEGEKLYTCKTCKETKTEVLAKKNTATDKNNTTTDKNNTTNGTVKTGDNTSVVLWGLLVAAACVIGGVTYNFKRKTK